MSPDYEQVHGEKCAVFGVSFLVKRGSLLAWGMWLMRCRLLGLCIAELTLKPFGTFDEVWGDNIVCRLIHVTLAQVRPDVSPSSAVQWPRKQWF